MTVIRTKIMVFFRPNRAEIVSFDDQFGENFCFVNRQHRLTRAHIQTLLPSQTFEPSFPPSHPPAYCHHSLSHLILSPVCPRQVQIAVQLQVNYRRETLLLLLMTFIGRKLRHAANAPSQPLHNNSYPRTGTFSVVS